jgi:hypothetical protein
MTRGTCNYAQANNVVLPKLLLSIYLPKHSNICLSHQKWKITQYKIVLYFLPKICEFIIKKNQTNLTMMVNQ